MNVPESAGSAWWREERRRRNDPANRDARRDALMRRLFGTEPEPTAETTRTTRRTTGRTRHDRPGVKVTGNCGSYGRSRRSHGGERVWTLPRTDPPAPSGDPGSSGVGVTAPNPGFRPAQPRGHPMNSFNQPSPDSQAARLEINARLYRFDATLEAAADLFDQDVAAWQKLPILLQDRSGQYRDARASYRRAVEAGAIRDDRGPAAAERTA